MWLNGVDEARASGEGVIGPKAILAARPTGRRRGLSIVTGGLRSGEGFVRVQGFAEIDWRKVVFLRVTVCHERISFVRGTRRRDG